MSEYTSPATVDRNAFQPHTEKLDRTQKRREKIQELVNKYSQNKNLTDVDRDQAKALREEILNDNDVPVESPWKHYDEVQAKMQTGQEHQTREQQVQSIIRDIKATIDSNIEGYKGVTQSTSYQTAISVRSVLNSFERGLTSSQTVDVLNNNGNPTVNADEALSKSSYYEKLINGKGKGIVKAEVVRGTGKAANSVDTKAVDSKYRIRIWVEQPNPAEAPTSPPTLREVANNRQRVNAEQRIREVIQSLKVEDVEAVLANPSIRVQNASQFDFMNGALNSQVTIGREYFGEALKNSFIDCSNKEISRLHTRITRDVNENLFLEDLNSKDGTYVNEVKVKPGQSVNLKEGDIIRLGAVTGEAFKIEGGGLRRYELFYQERKKRAQELQRTDKYKAEVVLPKAQGETESLRQKLEQSDTATRQLEATLKQEKEKNIKNLVRMLDSKNNTSDEIIQILTELKNLNYVFPGIVGDPESKPKRPEDIITAIRRVQAAPGPQEVNDLIYSVTSLKNIDVKVYREARGKWSRWQKITNGIPDKVSDRF